MFVYRLSSPPPPSLSLQFFFPNREPVHRLSLSLTWRSIPHRSAHKKGRKKKKKRPWDFSSSANKLFRLIIYVENIENLTYIASTKKPGYPHFFIKNNRRYCSTRPEILRTHTHTHKWKQWKVSFNLPTLTIPPALGPEALDFSRRLPRGQIVADKKEQGF